MITVIVPGKANPFELFMTLSEYFLLPFMVTVKSFHTIEAPEIFLATGGGGDGGGGDDDDVDLLLSLEGDGEAVVVAALMVSRPSSTLSSTSVSSQSGESSNEIGFLKEPGFLK